MSQRPKKPTAARGDEPVAAAETPDVVSGPSDVPRRRVYRKRLHARSRSIAARHLSRAELLERDQLPVVLDDPDRPRTRDDCEWMIGRPCPYVSCKHHLYLDVNPETGTIKLNFPDREVWELAETCSLDVADRGGITLEEVGAILNLTRERIRQVEVRGLLQLKLVRPGEEPVPGDPDWPDD